jgi:uncharacterized Fe-S cluster-containing radical SAM superfamily protein
VFSDPDKFAEKLRAVLLQSYMRTVLVAKLDNSLESHDNYTLTNCKGLGRIRVFTKYLMHLRTNTKAFPPKPLLRGHPPTRELRTQVFQLAGCNWRCWYCYVDDDLLSALPATGQYISAEQLVDLYLSTPDRPSVLDLSGGQPDLVPEWALWVMQSLEKRGMAGKVFIWQDDNLSTDMMWRVLTDKEIRYMASFPLHSRVGCFKGFDSVSFAFNTLAPARQFDRQFEIFKKLLTYGFDMYAYVTLTAPPGHASPVLISKFIDDLQRVHPLLPLRTIPLKIRPFSVTETRLNLMREGALAEQERAIEFWEDELRNRFDSDTISLPYESIPLKLPQT